MRLRNVKNKSDILRNNEVLVNNPEDYFGKWHELFGNDNPIYLEIGMGKGDFIIENALKYPNINFIGIEKFDNVIVRAIQKVSGHIDNLFFIRMDARELDSVFTREIDRIFLNFSDPWPKKRHWSRRLTSEFFLNKYARIFRQTCEIIQKTDNIDLFQYSIVSLNHHGYRIEEMFLDLHANEDIENIMTEYERRFFKRGDKIMYLRARK